METETFIADDTDNKELEKLKNEWENLRIEVDKLKKMTWIDLVLRIVAFFLMMYATLYPIITFETEVSFYAHYGSYFFYFLVSIVITLILFFEDFSFGNRLLRVSDSYQALHQIIQKRYAKKLDVTIDDDTAIYIARMLANIKTNDYPFPYYVRKIFFVIYIICTVISIMLISIVATKTIRGEEKTQFTTIESKMIILDNKLTKLQVQNDSLKLEIELLKKQIKK